MIEPTNKPFAHLHCHTHYSLLDGANRIPDLVKKTKENGMDSIAITDHGNLFGALEFYQTCKKEDVNPIIGYEAYVAPGKRTDRSATRRKDAAFHLTLLAMNKTGFKNLVKMASAAFLEGFYHTPRIDKELIEHYNEGIICLTGCASSELSRLILSEQKKESEELLAWYSKVFGDRLYLEIQDSGVQIQKDCLEGTVDLANKLGMPLVATNDAHYLNESDADAHDVLLCVNTRSQRSDEKRMRLGTQQFHLRTPEEMYETFSSFPDAVARSQEIANRVDIDLDLNARHFPVFTPPAEKTDVQYLREICDKGLHWRYGETPDSVYTERLDHELNIIEQMGYSSYFLICWDFARFARANGIPCTARGSACGAIVSYLLGISDVCPIKYDLLFERFLDPSRSEAPDIDIDFCRDRRQMVIDYVKEKYGEQNVAQIGTFGTLKAKAAIRDVSRALDVPLKRVDEIAKMVPETLGIKLKEALDTTPELKEQYDQDPDIKEVLDLAMALEGLARNAGTHAAGVVIADRPLDEYVPLQKITGKDDILTQWTDVERAGLLKMDFLGLRNLTILDKAVGNVKKHRNVDIVPIELPLDDKETFALLQRGETKGIFQLESGGMRDLLTKMKPDKFHDIIATSALYRPGPLEGGMVMTYVNVKNGKEPAPKVHPVVDEVLEETYGVMVYQEQVMRILNRVGDIELSSSYQCIKAISKKKLETMTKYKEQFIANAQTKNMDAKLATELWDLIEKFAGYGFNKSHSTAYGAIAYQTAYLKAHYPQEFMAALLSCGMESSDRISEHVDDCRRMKIEILPPDVNQSDVEFSVLGDKITFGMGAIKGVGEQAVGAIVEEREENGPFKNIFDLTERVDPKQLSKSVLEILIKAGALDSLGPNREQHLIASERAIQAAIAKHRDKARGQRSLFGGEDDSATDEMNEDFSLPEATDWSHSQKLAAEKDVFGFYLTSHPLSEYEDQLSQFSSNTIKELQEIEDREEVLLGGMISSIKKSSTKNPSRNGNSKYVNFDLEDSTGVIRCIMWPDDYARYVEEVVPDTLCFIQGRAERRGREPNVIVNRFMTLEKAEKEFTDQLAIKFQRGYHNEDDMRTVRKILQNHPGRTDVVLVVESSHEEQPEAHYRCILGTPNSMGVSCNASLKKELETALGRKNFKFHISNNKRNSS